jgi:Tol biopolymer transport system component
MRRVIRGIIGAGVVALSLAAGVALAAAPDGPRFAVVKLTLKPARLELLTVDPNGALPVRLAGGGRGSNPLPYPLTPPSWRPDGGEIAFNAAVGRKRGRDAPRRAIFIASADGGGVRRVPGTTGALWPIFSPDGHTIAFTRVREGRRFEAAAVWLLDLASGDRRRLTPWRDGLEYIASSFSPDGSTILATRSDDRRTDTPEPVAIRIDGGGVQRLLVDGLFPVYSPDGSQIAVFREEQEGRDADLFVLDVASGGIRRLARTPRTVELFASWDPSGERLAFVRFSSGSSENASLGFGDSIMQVNADGSCLTKTLSAPRAAFYAPAWQPGPGREAGRIGC